MNLFRLALGIFLTFIVIGLSAQQQQELDSLNQSVYFELNQYTLDTLAKNTIDTFVANHNLVSVKFKIQGYADYLGSVESNLKLSLQRAQTVKKWLTSKYQLSESQFLICEGKGELPALETGQKRKGNPNNRRVDVKMLYPIKIIDRTGIVKVKTQQIKTEKTPSQSKISSLKKGQNLVLKGVNFYPGSSKMIPKSNIALEELEQVMRADSALIIEIQGHVCCTPRGQDGVDEATGKKNLSYKRAEVVFDYLFSKGIPAKRMEYKGYGGSKKRYPKERSEKERRGNRRVEVKVLSRG